MSAPEAGDAIALWEAAGLTRPWNSPRADFDRAIAGPDSAVVGIRAAAALIGAAMVGHDGHRGWMYYLAVAQEHRHQGLGRALVAAAEEWIDARGIVKAQLMVRADNAGAFGFYRALGYEVQDVAVLGRRLDGGADR